MNRQRNAWITLRAVGRALSSLALILLAATDILAFALAHTWGAASGLAELFGLDDLVWGRIGIIATACILLLLARALARGKRQAWLLSVGLICFSFVAALIERASWAPLLLLLGLLLVLLTLAPLFPTRSDLHALQRGYVALILGFVAIIGHGIVHLLIHSGKTDILALEPRGLLYALQAAAYLLLSFGVVEVLRPVLRAHDTTAIERARVYEVVQRSGHRSLAHFTLGPALSYFWSESGRSFLAYRASNGIALALGDPVGSQEEFPRLLQAFLVFCHKQDWQLAIYQASASTIDAFMGDVIHAVKVGEEAIIDIARFTLQGKVGAPVRHAIARAKRGGLSIHCWHGEALPDYVFAGMKRISATWLHAHHTRSQMGFSMGRFPTDWSPNLLTCVAFGADGEVQAFVTWTPLYAGDGWALDNMRRAQETVPGAMEYLIATSIEWAQARGYRQMSLSLAPLVGLNDEWKTLASVIRPVRGRISRSARLVQRSAAYLHRRGILLGNYRSLYFFKQKFQPTWEPRYLVVENVSALPRALIALAVVHGMSWRTLLYELYAAMRESHQRGSRRMAQSAWDVDAERGFS